MYEFPLVDRDPLSHWKQGRVTLLGDAAHPMYPIGSNGASQAILDARSLADALAGQPGIDAAFDAYEADRLPKTASIVLLNRQNGPEQVMAIAEQRKIPRMLIVNKIDDHQVDVAALTEALRDTFGKVCLPINLPKPDLSGVINVRDTWRPMAVPRG